jgi:hypothetical protein
MMMIIILNVFTVASNKLILFYVDFDLKTFTVGFNLTLLNIPLTTQDFQDCKCVQ